MLFLPECFSFIGTSQQEVRCAAQHCFAGRLECALISCLLAVTSKGRAVGRPCYGKVQAACKVSCVAVAARDSGQHFAGGVV